jgi:hypothetical protein
MADEAVSMMRIEARSGQPPIERQDSLQKFGILKLISPISFAMSLKLAVASRSTS